MKNRRTFLALSAGALVASPLLATAATMDKPTGHTAIEMPTLHFAVADLEPHISAKTVDLHFGTHHMGYFKRLVPMLKEQGWESESLETVLSLTLNNPKLRGIYNNAGQLYNHNQYWKSLSPTPTAPSPALQAAIVRDFGSLEKLKEALKKEANGHFGSGWAWLATTDTGKLKVISTHDADCPLVMGMKGLLVVDVWEHAYYLDRQAGRANYTAAMIDNLLNWEFANANFAAI